MRLIITFLLFVLLATYIAFLNPHEVQFHITQSLTIRLPMVVLFLGFILTGVIITFLFNWTLQVKSSFRSLKTSLLHRRQENQSRRLQKFSRKGENAFTGGHLDKASALYEKILGESPDHIDALFALGNIKGREGNLSRALELHKKAAELAPENIKVLTGLAEDYAAAELHEKEIEVLEHIRKLDTHSPLPLMKMRDSYQTREDWSSACALQKKILPLIHKKEEKEKEQKRFSHLIYNNAMLHYENGNHDTAIAEFKRAIRTHNLCLPAYISLGDSYHNSGNHKAAVKAWKSGFNNTRSPICLLRMQKIDPESGHLNDIKKFYREAIVSSDNSEKETVVLLMGKLLLEQGETDEAVKTLESLQPQNSILHSVLLANAYQAAQNSGLWEKTCRSAFSKARDSIMEFTCTECKTSLKEWTGHCPVCKGWNSLACGPWSGRS